MKKRLLPALATSAMLAITLSSTAVLTPAASASAAEKSPQPSSKFQQPLHDAQELLQKHDYSGALAKLRQIDAMPGKTAYDQHLINDFMGFAYAKTNQLPEAAKAWEPELDDGFLPQQDLQTRTRAVATINYQLKNYDKAIEYGNRAIKGGFADEEIRTIVGQAYYLKGDYRNALKFQEAQVDTVIKGGSSPKKEQLLLIYSSCQKLVTYYPEPDYWSQLLYGMRQETSSNEADTLQTYRLMNEVDVLKTPGDYNEMAQLALEAGDAGEAQSVLEKGFQKGVFDDKLTKDRNQRLLDNAKKAAATDQASLARQEQEANAAPTGAKNVGVGLAYLGYGQYDKAADQIAKGLQKGGVPNDAQARLLLGIAQLKGGHKDEAVKSFHEVKGDPVLERLANLWSLHAKAA
jgi:tetratricopeptide (TPR) repeat protein